MSSLDLDNEIRKILRENIDRLSVALIMEVVDDLTDIMCESFAESLEISYEEVESKLFKAKRKIRNILEKERQ